VKASRINTTCEISVRMCPKNLRKEKRTPVRKKSDLQTSKNGPGFNSKNRKYSKADFGDRN
jgi:hypothetical protein